MAGLSDVRRPPSRSCSESHAQQPARTSAHPVRGFTKTSRAPPAALRSLSPALQVIQKSLLQDAPRVPDAPRGNRPREYLSMIQLSPAQGLHQTDLKRSPSPEIAIKDSGVAASVLDFPQSNSAVCRSSRPRTPDHRDDIGRDCCRKAPMSARTRRTPSENICHTPHAPLSARVDNTRPFSAIPLRSSEDHYGYGGNLWPADRPRRGGVTVFESDGFDALDALLTSVRNDMPRLDAPRSISTPTSPRTKPGSELKCGIAPIPASDHKSGTTPIRSQANTPANSVKYDEHVEAASPNVVEVDDSRPSVYCSMSATLMSVHLPGSPIPKAAEFDDSDSSVVILSDPLASTKPQSRGQKVRFECHGPKKVLSAQALTPQAPRRKGTASRPLGCTVVAFGGA